MLAWDIRNQVLNEEIDYICLKSILSNYAYPRDKISQLLKSKALIRVKKGLYIFSPTYAKQPYSQEVLANLIYGPSAISLEYALAFYGLIPERATTVTSITSKRDKQFNTPVGCFTYHYIHANKYDVGLVQKQLDRNHCILIAAPEKALADKLLLTKPKLSINSQDELENYLLTDLRFDLTQLKKFNLGLLRETAKYYQTKTVDLLINYIKSLNI